MMITNSRFYQFFVISDYKQVVTMSTRTAFHIVICQERHTFNVCHVFLCRLALSNPFDNAADVLSVREFNCRPVRLVAPPSLSLPELLSDSTTSDVTSGFPSPRKPPAAAVASPPAVTFPPFFLRRFAFTATVLEATSRSDDVAQGVLILLSTALTLLLLRRFGCVICSGK